MSEDTGRLAVNVLHFCRVLRRAGLPVGTGRALAALAAVRAVGVARRVDLYWTLHAVLVHRRDQRELYDQAFRLFWRNPDRANRFPLPSLAEDLPPPPPQAASRRVAEALLPGLGPRDRADRPPRPEADAVLTWSDREVLRHTDFEQMSAAELAAARRAIAAMRLPVREAPTRRFAADPAGARIDLRQTLRRSLRAGGAGIALARRRPRTRPPPLVVLCDISGSMSRYSRMLLHFVHAVATDRDRVHAFVFGTRLTPVTRALRHRDVDAALAGVARSVADWSGGTRIGDCLRAFNAAWSRRVLGQGAVVLLITDGLERDDTATLTAAMDRLHRSCRRLIWLNPLLRYAGYAPRSQGARAMMPHVDEFRPVHDLASLDALVAALSGPPGSPADIARWRARAADAAPATGAAGRAQP